MDSVREEVRRKLAGFKRDWMGGDNLSIVFCGLVEKHLELDQDPYSDNGWHEDVTDECDATLDALTDAIMSAFKRAPGVVVSPLVWEHVKGASDDGDAWFAKALNGLRYGVWDRGADGFEWELETEDGDFLITHGAEGTKQAAQDACRDDLAKRITSAVEPSCVVTDEAVERAYQVWLDHQPIGSARDTKEVLRASLTAALSSRTEEGPKWRPIAEAPYRVKVIARRSSDGVLVDGWVNENGSVTDHIYNNSHECDLFTFAWSVKPPARSLTNGGE